MFIQFFHHFVNIFFFFTWLSWFSFRLNSNFSSAWHDNQFFFCSFFAFFILTICLLRAPMHTIDGPSSWSISSHVRIVLKGLAFWSKVVYIIFQMRKVITQRLYHFCLQEKIMAQEIFWGMGNFRSTYPKASIVVISEYHDLGTCFFWSLKRFEAAASLDVYQITNYQFLKNSTFRLPDFRRI